jgi:uncharacterized coiled-coil protein SlyX
VAISIEVNQIVAARERQVTPNRWKILVAWRQSLLPPQRRQIAMYALEPVTFRYKPKVDPAHAPMFGLIAEDVEKVDRDLVSYNDKGEAETVRYEAVNAMLLNEFLKEHAKVQKLEAAAAQQEKEVKALTQLKSTVTKQEATIAKQQKQIEALTTFIRLEDKLQTQKTLI